MKTNVVEGMQPKLLSPKVLRIGFMIAAGAAVIGLGMFAYIWFSGGSGAASAPVSAPSLKVGGSTQLFRLQADQSEVRFIINETLIGQPKTVIGSTREVAGDLAIDFEAPQNSMVGVIRINLRTLNTDNEFRNRALRGQILHSTEPEFEFASFSPREITGIPDRITLGQTYELQIKGDLTLHGVTHEVIFESSVTAVNATIIKGSAKAQIRISDFGLTIPDAPGVANVSEVAQLEIDLTATRVEAP